MKGKTTKTGITNLVPVQVVLPKAPLPAFKIPKQWDSGIFGYRLPFPPSANTMKMPVKNTKQLVLTPQYRAWKMDVEASFKHLKDYPTLLGTKVGVYMAFMLPNRLRRDLANYEKAPIDALVHAGVIDDDCQIVSLQLECRGVCKPGHVDVSIWRIDV